MNLKNISVGEAVKRLNPKLFSRVEPEAKAILAKAPMRIRQSKPKLNQTEQAALAWLKAKYPSYDFRAHAIRLQLANGCWYYPDIVGHRDSSYNCIWEVKGKHAWDDAIVKLKVAAREWPMFDFYLIWNDGDWQEQYVLP